MEYNLKPDLERAAQHAESAKALVEFAKSESRELTAEEDVQLDSFMAQHQKAENA